MGVRPIIDIEVNDAEFRRFYELFEAYAAEVDQMPEAWRTLGAAMGESTRGLEAGSLGAKEALAIAAAQAGIIAEALRDATKAAHNLDRASERGAKGLDRLRKGAEGVGRAVSSVGGWIVKLGAIGGLGAIFSGFGIGELASSAFSRYRAAGRLGISPGALASFQVNAQQFLPVSALEAAANAQIDVSKAGYLAVLGIRYQAARAMSASDLAFAELKAARAAYLQSKRTGTPPMQNPAIAAYLALGGSIGDIRNAAMQPLSELLAAQNRTRADRGALGFDARTAQEWSNLKMTLDKAGLAIETDLIKKLGPLAPKLEKLTEGVVDAVAAFIGGKNFDVVIEDAKKGLSALADFVVKTDWKQIGEDITAFGKDVKTVAGWLSWLNPVKNAKDVFTPAGWRRDLNSPENQGTIKAIQWLWKTAGDKTHAILKAITGQESAGNYAAVNPTTGASGRYQFMPGTAASYLPKWWRSQYGDKITGRNASAAWKRNVGNVQDSVAVGYYEMLERHAYKLSHAHDNAALIAAGWYGGTGAMDAYFHKEGWVNRKQGAYPSVSDYVRKVVQRLRTEEREYRQSHPDRKPAPPEPRIIRRPSAQRVRPPVHVSVSNATSARVAVSLNAVSIV